MNTVDAGLPAACCAQSDNTETEDSNVMEDHVPAAGGKRNVQHALSLCVVTPFREQKWRWLSSYFDSSQYSWTFCNGSLYGRHELLWAPYALRSVLKARTADAVVSFHPYVTLWVAFWMWLLRVRKPHAAFGFNHGNKRFFNGWSMWIARRVLGRIDYFVVSSTGERELFNKRYGIPLNKLIFHHFAVNPPDVDDELPQSVAELQPYAICIGRNNRDLATLFEAVRGLPSRIVVVTREGAAEGLDMPENVMMRTEIPLRECMNLLNGASFHIVPILDNETGAGHMTMVAAMHLGKAQVVTRFENVQDYFTGGEHGLWADPRDAASLRAAIVTLNKDSDLRAQFASNGQAFASAWLSEPAAARNAAHMLEDWLAGRQPSTAPRDWGRASAASTG